MWPDGIPGSNTPNEEKGPTLRDLLFENLSVRTPGGFAGLLTLDALAQGVFAAWTDVQGMATNDWRNPYTGETVPGSEYGQGLDNLKYFFIPVGGAGKVAAEVGEGSFASGVLKDIVANTSEQTPFQRGMQFQEDVLSALGLPENTQRITSTLSDGSLMTVIPDARDGSTIIEIKDVINISNSDQFRGYFSTGNPIQLIVSPNTQTISKPLQDLIRNSGGSIQVFDPATKIFNPWDP